MMQSLLPARLRPHSALSLGVCARDSICQWGACTSQDMNTRRMSSVTELPPVSFNPLNAPQLATAAFEHMHALTGLPWWASIPLTALALKGLLIPLSIQAKRASASISLLHLSFLKSKEVLDYIKKNNSSRFDVMSFEQLGRVSTTHRIYHYILWKNEVPKFRWYFLNAAAQTTLVACLTVSLARMCENVWPGFTTEGLPLLQDLTNAAVYPSTLSTPFGVAGTVIPLILAVNYNKLMDQTAAAKHPGLSIGMRLLGIPYYCLLLLQPQAVVLCWAAVQLSTYAMQVVLNRPPATSYFKINPLLALPSSAVRVSPPEAEQQKEEMLDVLSDPTFLASFAKECAATRSAGTTVGVPIAITLLELAIHHAPDDIALARQLSSLHAFSLNYPTAAKLIANCVRLVESPAEKSALHMEAADLHLDGAKIAGHDELYTRPMLEGLLNPAYRHIDDVQTLTPGHPWIKYCKSRAAAVLGEMDVSEALARECVKQLSLDINLSHTDPALASLAERLAIHIVYLAYQLRSKLQLKEALDLVREAVPMARTGETLKRARHLALDIEDDLYDEEEAATAKENAALKSPGAVNSKA